MYIICFNTFLAKLKFHSLFWIERTVCWCIFQLYENGHVARHAGITFGKVYNAASRKMGRKPCPSIYTGWQLRVVWTSTLPHMSFGVAITSRVFIMFWKTGMCTYDCMTELDNVNVAPFSSCICVLSIRSIVFSLKTPLEVIFTKPPLNKEL